MPPAELEDAAVLGVETATALEDEALGGVELTAGVDGAVLVDAELLAELDDALVGFTTVFTRAAEPLGKPSLLSAQTGRLATDINPIRLRLYALNTNFVSPMTIRPLEE